VSCRGLIFFYVILMRTLRWRDWEHEAWSTYMLWCYRQTHLPAPHRHDFYELFWVESGAGVHWINGHEEPLRPGDLILIRPEDAHSFAAAKAREFVQFVNISFRPDIWQAITRRHPHTSSTYFGHREFPKRKHVLHSGDIARVGVLAEALRMGSHDRFTTEAFVMGLLALLRAERDTLHAPAMPRWLEVAVAQIRHYPNFAGGAAAFARLAGRSPEHVARECRRYLGRKPIDLVNEARLLHASHELQATDKPILDIALECGVENVGHFYQLFRRHYGKTPSVYRREQEPPRQYH
jgi:AraC-like DNA-binding protein